MANVEVPAGLFERIDDWMAQTDRQPPGVQPGSSLAGDDRKLPELKVSDACWAAFGHATDHLHALRLLLGNLGAAHPFASYTLLRSALESASTTLWLLHPASRKDRLTRRLQLAHLEAYESGKVQNLTGALPAPPGRAAPERLAELRQLATDLGVDQVAVSGRHVSYRDIVRAGSDGATLDPDTAETVWRLYSGFAHGRTWATLGYLDREVIGTHDGSVDVKVTTNVGSLVLNMRTVATFIAAGRALYERRRTTTGPRSA